MTTIADVRTKEQAQPGGLYWERVEPPRLPGHLCFDLMRDGQPVMYEANGKSGGLMIMQRDDDWGRGWLTAFSDWKLQEFERRAKQSV